jgi:hypothetical protein
MTLYPEVQRKAQAEIDRVIGNACLPVYSDEAALSYLQVAQGGFTLGPCHSTQYALVTMLPVPEH